MDPFPVLLGPDPPEGAVDTETENVLVLAGLKIPLEALTLWGRSEGRVWEPLAQTGVHITLTAGARVRLRSSLRTRA